MQEEQQQKIKPGVLKKQKIKLFNKEMYLLGIDKEGVKYWLEEPSFDCGWYWGFGYIETLTNNENPEQSRDINSHQHFDGFIIGQQEEYNSKKQCFEKTKYTHHLNEVLFKSVLNDDESWKLSELMQSFYILGKTASFFKEGDAHITTNPLKDKLKDEALYKRINKELIPLIFEEVIKLLSPEKEIKDYKKEVVFK